MYGCLLYDKRRNHSSQRSARETKNPEPKPYRGVGREKTTYHMLRPFESMVCLVFVWSVGGGKEERLGVRGTEPSVCLVVELKTDWKVRGWSVVGAGQNGRETVQVVCRHKCGHCCFLRAGE